MSFFKLIVDQVLVFRLDHRLRPGYYSGGQGGNTEYLLTRCQFFDWIAGSSKVIIVGDNPVLNRVWYYESRDVNLDCELSQMKEHAIEWRTTSSGAFLSLIIFSQVDLLLQRSTFYGCNNCSLLG